MEKLNNNLVESIVECGKNVFCNGIYVPCNEHPCGWDFINFDFIDSKEATNYRLDNQDISNGIYLDHPFEGMTLLEVLTETKGKYEFEIGSIDW